jgi:hypothetical protein
MYNIFHFQLYIFIIFHSTILSATTYNDDTLNIFSKISPRLVLMSSQKEKLTDEINICILHNEMDKKLSSLLVYKTNHNYPNGIKNYKINFIKSDYSNIQNCQNSQLIFLFNTDERNIQKALEYSKTNKILTISYDQKMLENGVDMSLFLGKKIIPYINIESILKKDISLNNILLRISKIYILGDK